MEEIKFMVCVRADELTDEPENSSRTACVECGSDIWISDESRSKSAELKAMPVCSRCSLRLAETMPSEVQHLYGDGTVDDASSANLQDLARDINSLISDLQSGEEDDMDLFDRMKQTARLAGKSMEKPGDDWGSIVIMENFDGALFPPIPLGAMLQQGLPKEMIANQLLPGLVVTSQARRVLMGISSWTLTLEKDADPHDLGMAVSAHPDREERLVLLDITADGVQQMTYAQIHRDGISGPTLGEWEDVETPDTEGLFLDALLPALALVKTLREAVRS